MGVEGATTTLVGRQETHGRKYPSLIEKLVLLATIVTAIMAGQWIWTQSNWPAIAMWPAIVCGLPLGTLFVTEMLARVIQKINTGNQ